mmetsp:Transcript_22810/g.60737  ORF Transcript_22810/g.60737 Transcript_22810/m.60737 type:complete len:330 (-) Transcript_22810:579-1568(-)
MRHHPPGRGSGGSAHDVANGQGDEVATAVADHLLSKHRRRHRRGRRRGGAGHLVEVLVGHGQIVNDFIVCHLMPPAGRQTQLVLDGFLHVVIVEDLQQNIGDLAVHVKFEEQSMLALLDHPGAIVADAVYLHNVVADPHTFLGVLNVPRLREPTSDPSDEQSGAAAVANGVRVVELQAKFAVSRPVEGDQALVIGAVGPQDRPAVQVPLQKEDRPIVRHAPAARLPQHLPEAPRERHLGAVQLVDAFVLQRCGQLRHWEVRPREAEPYSGTIPLLHDAPAHEGLLRIRHGYACHTRLGQPAEQRAAGVLRAPGAPESKHGLEVAIVGGR